MLNIRLSATDHNHGRRIASTACMNSLLASRALACRARRSAELGSRTLLFQALLLLLAIPPAAARTWTTALVEGYQTEWKFFAKFAFTETTWSDPGLVYLRAWTFMAGQKVVLYENDDWFSALERTTCEERFALGFSNSSVQQGSFYGEAGRVIATTVVHPSPSYVFLALARCASWLEEQPHDACTGVRPDGEIPNGVFLYFELTMLNPGGWWRQHL